MHNFVPQHYKYITVIILICGSLY